MILKAVQIDIMCPWWSVSSSNRVRQRYENFQEVNTECIEAEILAGLH